MTATESIELFRQDGEEFRSVILSIEPDGAIRLDAQDMGPRVQEWWGDCDYEFWVTVPSRALSKLAFALLREKYAGRGGAVGELRTFCEQQKIEHTFDSWV